MNRKQKYKGVLTALFMAVILAFAISSITTLINVGFVPSFFVEVIKRFSLAVIIAFPTAWVVAPLVRKVVNRLLDN
jgi:predicted exporter